MTEENILVEATQEKQEDAKPLLPYTHGMTIEQINSLLTKMHKTVIAENDPILMVVTMLNAYLAEVEKLHGRHEKGLTRLMAEKTDEYVSGVQTAVNQLSTSLSSASVDGIRKVFDDHAATLKTFKSNVYLAAIIIGMSALLNVAVFILRAAK